MSYYTHKSGFEKRKLKLEKEEKVISNTQVISTLFKPVQTSSNQYTFCENYTTWQYCIRNELILLRWK